MEKKSLLLKKMGFSLLLCAMLLSSASIYGSTFTASSSGNWSSSLTWGGTGAPSFNLTTDQVIIPSGITVSIDNNVTVTGATASVAVQGTLTSTASESLTLGALGSLIGNGTLNIGGLHLQALSVMTFSGSATVDTLTTALASLQLSGGLAVNNALNLSAGTLTFGTGSSLTMGTGSTIILAGGTLSNSGGTLALTASYNVTYAIASATTGVELSGSGLNNVTINVSSGNSVTLSSALTVPGTLSLTSGTLVLNGNNLTLSGSIATSGNGLITSTSVSSIALNTTGNANGVITFTTGSSVANLTINVGAGNTIGIAGSNLAVSGTLALTSGNINIGNDTLNLGVGGSITGGSSTSYVIASGNGALGIQLTAGAGSSTVFPVGTTLNFAPASLQLNSGSTSGTVYVTVDTGVSAQGTSGIDLSLTQPMVNTSWMIEPSFSGNVSMNIQLMWSAGMQVNGFNFDSAYVSHFINGAWNINPVSAATTVNGMYQLGLSGITSFSPFAVFGNRANTASGIPQVSDNSVQFEIYPNPATDNLVIKNVGGTETLYAELVNILGQVVERYQLTNITTNISLIGLTSGEYFMRLYNDNISMVKKFIKR